LQVERESDLVLVKEEGILWLGEVLFDLDLSYWFGFWFIPCLFKELFKDVKQLDALLLLQLILLIDLLFFEHSLFSCTHVFKFMVNWR